MIGIPGAGILAVPTSELEDLRAEDLVAITALAEPWMVGARLAAARRAELSHHLVARQARPSPSPVETQVTWLAAWDGGDPEG